jgi:hypothetical protein
MCPGGVRTTGDTCYTSMTTALQSHTLTLNSVVLIALKKSPNPSVSTADEVTVNMRVRGTFITLLAANNGARGAIAHFRDRAPADTIVSVQAIARTNGMLRAHIKPREPQHGERIVIQVMALNARWPEKTELENESMSVVSP